MIMRGLFFSAIIVASLACLASPCQAQSMEGVWRGQWTSAPNATQRREHRGTLRVRLNETHPGTYQGLFTGRFAVIIPYVYRAPVVQQGNQLYSQKRLGPMGQYVMQLGTDGGSQLLGNWSAGSSEGSIQLYRVR